MSELSNSGKSEIERALAAVAGEQRVRLLGPFQFAYNDEGIGLEGKTLSGALPENGRILSVSIFFEEDFNGGAEQSIDLEIGDSFNGPAGLIFFSAKNNGSGFRLAGMALDIHYLGEIVTFAHAKWEGTPPLRIYYYEDDPATAGIGYVEVLIAEPVE